MKRKGTNIITDDDITMTGNKRGGETLSDSLDNIDQRVDKLESNVKWIYKYGGVGSGTGGGGGGGSSSAWKVIITRDDTGAVVTSEDTQYFGSPGNYSFSVQVYGGGTSTFLVTYSYVNSKGTQSKSEVVSASQGFLSRQSLGLDTNGTLSITILNQDTQEPIAYNINYITTSYIFSIGYVYKDNPSSYYKPANNTIFMGDVASLGLQVAFTSNVAVPIASASYTYQDWEGNYHTVSSEGGSTGKEIEGKKNKTILLDLTEQVDIKTYLSNPENARYKQFSLSITLYLEGSTDPETIDVLYLKDNLVPTNMYLKVVTSAGSLYSDPQLLYPDEGKFPLGTAVFNLTPYFGALDPTRIYNLYVKMGSNPQSLVPVTTDISQLSDQITHSVSVPITESGEKYIQFEIMAESHNYVVGYYLCVRESSSNFDWYPDFLGKTEEGKQIDPPFPAYYKRFAEDTIGIVDSSGALLPKSGVISMTINSSKTTYTLTNTSSESPSSYNEYDQFFCLGIQYSKINDFSVPIASFNTGLSETGSIFIYQDRVIISTQTGQSIPEDGVGVVGTTKEIFFPLVDNLDESESGNSSYHTVSIYKRFEYREGNNYYKIISIYIDGVLEGVVNNLTTVHRRYGTISFYPGNYYCNLIENSCFQHGEGASQKTWLEDNDLVGYNFAYREKVFQEDQSDEKTLFDLFENLSNDSDNFILTDETTISNIANNSKVPCIVYNFTDGDGSGIGAYHGYGQDNFRLWMSATYDESYDSPAAPITVQWSNGTGGLLQSIKIDGETSPATFFVELQGSSTMGYRCKNWELLAPNHESSTSRYIYSPNFSATDTTSFLPEESFTLKADVVDSSHSNNNAIASFVNTVTTPFAGAKQASSIYSSYIKNCLTGFPVLVFLHTRYKQDATTTEWIDKYYFLGIYNFNLGRKSAFNLGYKNISKLDDLNLQNGFKIYEIDEQDNAILNGVRVAEIQGNNPHFDFSQWDETILYATDNTDATYMFGDFVDGYSGQSATDAKAKIKTFTQKVAKAGGYAFTKIGKNFSNSAEDGHYGYDYKYSAVDASGVPRNMVPNYKWQAVRTRIGTESQYTYNQIQETATENDLKHLIIEPGSEETEQWTVGLDYASLCEYYTVCMAFGLVDSVQKNLNIKSWNSGDKFYLAFYDMDTCLGVSNAGSKINYFAFSDYWYSPLSADKKMLETIVYRDYSPLEEQSSEGGESTSAFFDVPSSYLFAIAKYAYCLLGDQTIVLHPCNIWGKWRHNMQSATDPQQGCLKNSKMFMNTYYSHHLDRVPKSAFNYNYRYKYLVFDSNNRSTFDSVNYPKFYGRKVAYTEDWLEGRLHILDAYFNLNSIPDVLVQNPTIIAPMADQDYVSHQNTDIYVLRDIFSDSTNGNQYSEMDQIIQVKARPYAPFIVKGANESHRYIFPSTSQTVKLNIKSNGVQNQLYGGSSLWTDLNTINPFITKAKTLTINSQYFTSLVGNSGFCSSWSIGTPSIKRVMLTSSNYSGTLNFESSGTVQNYPNLREIVVDGSGIELSINRATPTKVSALNMKTGSSVNIQNVTSLTDVGLSGNMSSLNITSWKNGIYLPTTYPISSSSVLNCTRITISNNTTRFPENTLVVANNETLTTLSFSGFKSVTVSNCPRLTTINIQDTAGNHVLESLSVVMPTSSSITNPPTTFTIGTVQGVADLSNEVNLSSIRLQNCLMSIVKLPSSTINLPSSAFYHCYNLKYLDGNGTYNITGTSTFMDCPLFELRQSDGTGCGLYVPSTTTSLSSTFYISDSNKKGSINLGWAKDFLDRCCVNANYVNSIESMFRNQNIVYTQSNFIEDYIAGTCRLKLSYFPRATSVSYCFWSNSISAYNRYMFTGLASLAEGISFTNILSGGSSIYTTLDFLEDIIENISSLSLYHISLVFMEKNDPDHPTTLRKIQTDSENGLPVASIFSPNGKYPVRLTSLGGFEIHPDHYLNLSGLFNNHWTAAVTSGISIDTVFYYNAYKVIAGTLDGLLKPIKIKSISSFLSSVTNYKDPDNGDRVNLGTFLDWDNIGSTTNLFFSTAGSLGFNKYIKYKETDSEKPPYDFQYVWNKIIRSGSLTSIGYLFKDCLITEIDVKDPTEELKTSKFYLLDPETESSVPINRRITQLGYLFMNCRSTIKSIDETITAVDYTYWDIDYTFFKHLPGITWCGYLFYNTYWTHGIPFNFFWKRVSQTISSKVFVNYYNPESPDPDDKYEARPGIIHTYNYTRDMTYMINAFTNIKLKAGQSGNRTYGFDQYAEYNGNGDIITRASLKRLDGSVEVEGETYTEYYTATKKVVTPEYTVTKVVPSSRLDFSQPTEIQDIDYQENAETNGLIDYKVNVTLSTGDVARNYDISGYYGLILPPDILYSVVSGVTTAIDSVFNASDVAELDRVFTGILPPNLLKNCKSSIITSTFRNLMVIPVRIHQSIEIDEEETTIYHQHFLFVPSGFTTCETLNSAFRFRFIIPASDSAHKQYYYYLLSDSISENTTTLSSAYPSPGSYPQSYIFGLGISYWRTDSGIRIIPIATKTISEGNIVFESGLDILNRFTKLRLDNYLSSYTALIMSGNIFRTSFEWSTSYFQSEDTYLINAGYGYSGGGGISCLITPSDWPVYNRRFIRRTDGSCYVLKSLVTNYDSLDLNQYPNINFIDS